MVGVASGTSILFRISSASEQPADADQSNNIPPKSKKPKITYNKKTTGDAPRPTTATSSGLRRRNTAASRTRSGRDTPEGGAKSPVATSEDTGAVTSRHVQLGVNGLTPVDVDKAQVGTARETTQDSDVTQYHDVDEPPAHQVGVSGLPPVDGDKAQVGTAREITQDGDVTQHHNVAEPPADNVTATKPSPGEDDTIRRDVKTPTRTDPGPGDSDPSGGGHGEPPAQYKDTAPLLGEDRATVPSPDRDTGTKSPAQ